MSSKKVIIEKMNGQFIVGTLKDSDDKSITLKEPYLINAGQDGNLNLIPLFVAYPFFKAGKNNEKTFDIRVVADFSEAEEKFGKFYEEVVKETNKQQSGLILPETPELIV